jgi:hypothetical protein
MRGECELFTHHRSHIHRRGPLSQWVEIRIVGGFRVGAEHRGIHRDVHFVDHRGEAAPALASHNAVKIASPEVLTIAGGLQLALHRHWTHQIQSQPFECRILRRELAYGLDRPPVEIPNVHAQHSPLT